MDVFLKKQSVSNSCLPLRFWDILGGAFPTILKKTYNPYCETRGLWISFPYLGTEYRGSALTTLLLCPLPPVDAHRGETNIMVVVMVRMATKILTLLGNSDLRRCCCLGLPLELPPAGGRSRGGPLPAGGS